jgi:hypothetical protein
MKSIRKRRAPKTRWTSELAKTRAITIRQPWAWLIVNGYKDIENRSWSTRKLGPLLIHAGASRAELSEKELTLIKRRYSVRLPKSFEHSGVIGLVDVAACKERSSSPWHIRGSVGWVLEKPRRLPHRACKGALGLFRPKFGRP